MEKEREREGGGVGPTVLKEGGRGSIGVSYRRESQPLLLPIPGPTARPPSLGGSGQAGGGGWGGEGIVGQRESCCGGGEAKGMGVALRIGLGHL